MRFFVHDAEGNITEAGDCGPIELQLRGGPGLTVREGEANPIRQYYDIATGTVVDYDDATVLRRFAARPGFRWSLGQWVDDRTLDQAKFQKLNEIRLAAIASATGGFVAGGFNWDSDLATQQRMQLTWQDMKEADGPTSVTWHTKEGDSKTLTPAQFKALARALRNHLAQQQDRAATLRETINAATTVAQVAAISW